MAQVSLRKVIKRFDDTEAVRGIDLDIADKEFVVLVGPSGCGKSTLLRMIAGLENITAGEIRIGERVVNNMPPKERDIAMVFQNYALYPHMTVRQNLSFGLETMGAPRPQIEQALRNAFGKRKGFQRTFEFAHFNDPARVAAAVRKRRVVPDKPASMVTPDRLKRPPLPWTSNPSLVSCTGAPRA